MYGNAPVWEFQVLAGAGIAVWASNPRGSTGYGQAFNAANFRDWGDGPTRDVLAGIDALVADGLADPDRLGLTGGSYGGYLTNWTIARDHRFKAAFTARSVSDMMSPTCSPATSAAASSGAWSSASRRGRTPTTTARSRR